MHRVNRTIILDNYHTKEEKGEFELFYNAQELRTYDDIKNKFKNFRLEQEYVDELIEEGCSSITYLRFFLHNEEKDILLFGIDFMLSSTIDFRYEFICLYGKEDELREIHDIYENYLIKIKYETNFYKHTPLGEYQWEDEEDPRDPQDQEEPPPLAISYHYNECVICYEEKPNILNYPCLHLSQCEACDENGKFNKCVICKEEIEYRIKI